jgi:hypothetical protein
VGIYEEYGDLIATLRSEGRTLQQIGDRLGVTRERVRQVLREHFPNCSPPLSTEEAAKTLGMSYCQFRSAAKHLGIQPVSRTRNRIWWSLDVLPIVRAAQKPRSCRICGRPLPSPRHVYCSKQCLSQGRRYANRSLPQKETVGFSAAPRKEV